MYRTMTLIALRNNIDLEDEEAILEIAKKSKLQIDSQAGDENDYTSVKLNGEDITEDIRSNQVGSAVSIVSKLSGIRKYLSLLIVKYSVSNRIEFSAKLDFFGIGLYRNHLERIGKVLG